MKTKQERIESIVYITENINLLKEINNDEIIFLICFETNSKVQISLKKDNLYIDDRYSFIKSELLKTPFFNIKANSYFEEKGLIFKEKIRKFNPSYELINDWTLEDLYQVFSIANSYEECIEEAKAVKKKAEEKRIKEEKEEFIRFHFEACFEKD